MNNIATLNSTELDLMTVSIDSTLTCTVTDTLRDYYEKDVENTKELLNLRKNGIKNVIFNPPATIVFWNDGTKTVVKCQNDEAFDPEKGLAMAIAKKHFGNKGSYCNQIRKWTEKYEEQLLYNGRLFAYMSARVTKIANRLHLIKNVHRIQTAYTTLTDVLNKKRPRKDDLTAAMEEAIGYLGEVLDD